MGTGCPHPDDLRQYAADPAHDADGRLAGHIALCAVCRAAVEQTQSFSLTPGSMTLPTAPPVDDTVRPMPAQGVDATEPVEATRTIALGGRPAPPAPDLPAAIGAIEIGPRIGQGGMGVVHRGRDRMLGRDVAVKFLLHAVAGEDDPRFEEFLVGARHAAGVRHAQLVTLHQADLVGGVPYLLMEFVDGPTLRDVLHHHRALPVPVALRVMCDVAAAVAALHDQGVIHRDIKPSNILFDHDGRLYVTDFGLSCPRPRDAYGGGGRVSGSPPYMAPEMFAGHISPRSDVYALGVMLYELLAGRPPFVGPTDELRRLHEQAPPPSEPLDTRGVPAAVCEVIERALHKRDIFRFKTAREFIRAIESCQVPLASDLDLRRMTIIERSSGAASADPASGSGSASSYFDRLNELATAKLGTRSDAPRPITTTPTVASEAEEEPLRLHGVPCRRCGGELYQIPITESCPRCGLPASETEAVYRLTASDPAWRRRLVRGVRWLRGGLGLAGVAGCILPLAGLISLWRDEAVGSGAVGATPMTARLVTLFVVLLPLVVGVVLTLSREPRSAGVALGQQLCRWGRTAAVLTVVWAALGVVVWSGQAPGAGLLILQSAPAPLACAVLLALMRLSGLALRLRDTRLATGLQSSAFLLGFAGLLVCFVDMIPERGDDSVGLRLVPTVGLFTGLALLGAVLWTAALLGQFRQAVEALKTERDAPATNTEPTRPSPPQRP